MKLRFGFVSNSSSTSFCMYGSIFEFNKIIEVFDDVYEQKRQELLKQMKENCERNGFDFNEEEEYVEDYEIIEFIVDDIVKNSNLNYMINGEDESVLVGRNFTNIGDDETGSQFKQNAEEQIKDLFGEDVECQKQEGIWYS